MIYALALFASVVASTQAASQLEVNSVSLFEGFKSKFQVSYATVEEESKRLSIFKENMKQADIRNALQLADGGSDSVFGVTKFSDWTDEEFKVLLGRKDTAPGLKLNKVDVRNPADGKSYGIKDFKPLTALPTYVNWQASGMITPIKNQGQCGSCWAFSVAETLESQWILQGNAPWEFSPQQIASCVTNCNGCGGGLQTYAYNYLMGLPSTEGLGSAWWAPYIQSMTSGCSNSRCTEACSTLDISTLITKSSLTGPYAVLTAYTESIPTCSGACTSQNLTALQLSIATYGPASVSVNAANWNTYTGGVMTASACGGSASTDLDHAVQLIGYNNQVASPYWIVRNSWATNWGESGLIYLALTTNTCGVADEPTMVTITNSQ